MLPYLAVTRAADIELFALEIFRGTAAGIGPGEVRSVGSLGSENSSWWFDLVMQTL
jgi:hypothetical protein